MKLFKNIGSVGIIGMIPSLNSPPMNPFVVQLYLECGLLRLIFFCLSYNFFDQCQSAESVFCSIKN
jgi:hypothetical protein